MTDGLFSQRVRTYEQETEWICAPAFIEPLAPAVFGGGKMLDVCAGTGIIAEYAHDLGWQASALDSNIDMLKNVADPVTVYLGDAHHMPFQDNSFDLVSCRQGIQYLDFTDAIREMLRVSSGQVRMLHAFIDQDDIECWQHLFALVHGPKRRFFSCDMLNDAIRCCNHSTMEVSFLKSKEQFRKPAGMRAAVDQFLEEHPDFITRYRVENHSDSFFYDLNWAVHIITK